MTEPNRFYRRAEDAALLSAAPDMLAALKSVITWYGVAPHPEPPAMRAARAAIAKAEGRAS